MIRRHVLRVRRGRDVLLVHLILLGLFRRLFQVHRRTIPRPVCGTAETSLLDKLFYDFPVVDLLLQNNFLFVKRVEPTVRMSIAEIFPDDILDDFSLRVRGCWRAHAHGFWRTRHRLCVLNYHVLVLDDEVTR